LHNTLNIKLIQKNPTMPLTRRNFLELVGGWLGTTTLSEASQRIVHEDLFIAKDLGVAFQKPRRWIFIAPETLAREADDIGEAVGMESMSPSVMNISKEPWTVNPKRFTPGINIWSHPRDQFDSAMTCLNDFEDSQSFYPDFISTGTIHNRQLKDGLAIASNCEFTFTTIGLDRPTPVRCEMIVIEQASNYLQILLCDSPPFGFVESTAFDAFLQSIRYVTELPTA
jgi:hypothetical protein